MKKQVKESVLFLGVNVCVLKLRIQHNSPLQSREHDKSRWPKQKESHRKKRILFYTRVGIRGRTSVEARAERKIFNREFFFSNPDF